jgi:hypothetical protein
MEGKERWDPGTTRVSLGRLGTGAGKSKVGAICGRACVLCGGSVLGDVHEQVSAMYCIARLQHVMGVVVT